MPPTPKKPIHLRLWHRRIGLTAALFAVLLSGTGVLLNHTEDLQLDSRFVTSDLVLDWYGVSAPKESLSYAIGDHWVSQFGAQIYWDARELAADQAKLLGAVQMADNIVIAVEGHLLVLDATGDLLETLGGAEGVPAGMQALGMKDGKLVVRASHGDYLTDQDLLQWEESEQNEVRIPVDAAWARPTFPPEHLKVQLIDAYRGKGLPLERVLLDLHSGRVLGTAGVLVVDLMAILIAILAVTGVWMWVRHARRINNCK